MVCIVFYDIENNKVRTKVAKKLLEYGLVRLQFSVFAGPYERVTFDELWQNITELIKQKQGEQDKFYYILVSINQFKNLKMYGETVDVNYICGTSHTMIL